MGFLNAVVVLAAASTNWWTPEANVDRAPKGDLYDDTKVVTNVDESSFVHTNEFGRTHYLKQGKLVLDASTLSVPGATAAPGIVVIGNEHKTSNYSGYLKMGHDTAIYAVAGEDMASPQRFDDPDLGNTYETLDVRYDHMARKIFNDMMEGKSATYTNFLYGAVGHGRMDDSLTGAIMMGWYPADGGGVERHRVIEQVSYKTELVPNGDGTVTTNKYQVRPFGKKQVDVTGLDENWRWLKPFWTFYGYASGLWLGGPWSDEKDEDFAYGVYADPEKMVFDLRDANHPDGGELATISDIDSRVAGVTGTTVSLGNTNTTAKTVNVGTNTLASVIDAAIAAHASATNNPHKVTAADLGARSLADLAVYEVTTNAQTGAVSTNATEDALVKKSEVGGIVTARQYTDLWDIENGETIRLYFAWNEESESPESPWLSSIEGWNGRDSPPYFPVYYTSVSDTNITSVTLTYYEKSLGDGAIQLQATRQLKNALGLACIGDNVSEFANDAGYLTAESDPSTALTNGTAWVRGKKVISSETDPAFAAWTNGTSIALGRESKASNSVVVGMDSEADDISVAIGNTSKATGNSSVAIGNSATATNSNTIAIGNMAHATGRGSIAIGHETYVTNKNVVAFGETPSNVLFGATYSAYRELDQPARTLQSYLDERATTNALADVEAKIPVISATDATFSNAVNAAARALVKAKLESLDKAKSSIGETIAALQSIYTETETK